MAGGANSEMPFRTSSSPPHEDTADESLRVDLAPTAPSTSAQSYEISIRLGTRKRHLRARQEVEMKGSIQPPSASDRTTSHAIRGSGSPDWTRGRSSASLQPCGDAVQIP